MQGEMKWEAMWGCRIPAILMQECPLPQPEGQAVALLPPPNSGMLIPSCPEFQCKAISRAAEGLSGLRKHGYCGKSIQELNRDGDTGARASPVPSPRRAQ